MPVTPILPSDRQLVDAARHGHDAAWQELMERHRGSILVVLGARRRSARLHATDRIEDLRKGLTDADPREREGAEAIRAFRPRAIAEVTGGTFGPAAASQVDDDPQVLLARAFGRLPEPWQAVLWHSHVEQLSAAEVSPLVGRATSDVTDLVATAERGLVDAYALEVLEACEVDDETAAVIPMLGGYVRDALPPHDQRRVERRLAAAADDPAPSGATLVSDMLTLVRRLPDVLPDAVAPGLTGLSVAEHRERLGTTDRSFGTATLFANRSDRARRAIVLGSVAAVVLALVGVASLARQSSDEPLGAPTSAQPVEDPTTPSTPPTSDEPGNSGFDPTVPETTELDLRPDVSEPMNTVELIFDEGIRAVGLQTTPPPLIAVVTSPAPVFAGGTGTLDIAVTNTSAAAVGASIEIVLPRGVVFQALVAGDANCMEPENDSPFCNVSVEAAATLDMSIRVALESSVVGRLQVEGDALVEALDVPIVATRDLIHNSVGRGDAVVIGNTVMTCDDAAAAELGISCVDVHAGTGEVVNRWDVPMTFTGAAPVLGLSNSSVATLEMPDGATVVDARLFWSGDLKQGGVVVAPEAEPTVTMRTPEGTIVRIAAEELKLGDQDSTQYVGRADVTELVAAGGSGDYLVGDIATAEVQGSYGAWALVVVYDHDSLPRRHRIVTDPFDWVAPEAPFSYAVDMPVPVSIGAPAHLDIVAYEGERGFAPEQLVVGGRQLGGDNPFDSTISGPRSPAFDNNLGVDIDAYDLTIDSPNGILDISATSGDDGIRLAVIALTVDLAS